MCASLLEALLAACLLVGVFVVGGALVVVGPAGAAADGRFCLYTPPSRHPHSRALLWDSNKRPDAPVDQLHVRTA